MITFASTTVDLSRLQFATTSIYHFLFVPLTLGLAPLVAIMQTVWHRTHDDAWLRLTRFFGTLLLINFAIGVATGLVQEFQFGMNWSVYSNFVGGVFGPPLAIEGLAAFMLEATFLGLWIFGWNHLPARLHLATIWITALATWLSAYLILVANSWMQHPVGYKVVHGKAQLTSVGSLLTNHFALIAWVHVILAGNFLDLFGPYTVFAGLAAVALFAFHGATYLSLRTIGDFCERATRFARRLSIPAVIFGIAFVAWTVLVAHDRNSRGIVPTATPAALTAAALILAIVFSRLRRSGWAFSMTGLAAIGYVATIFTGLYPRVLVSSPSFVNSLTVSNAVSGHYALQVITVVAAIFTPLVLLYQGWTYHVFRRRLGGERVRPPLAAASEGGGVAPR